jgi:predicted N-formylglutamate amidohydrolase
VHTARSRSVIDVNRDPSGPSLYPGQATTGLVPTETFDGRPLYHAAAAPTSDEIERRKRLYFAPYHAALDDELGRLQSKHWRIVSQPQNRGDERWVRRGIRLAIAQRVSQLRGAERPGCRLTAALASVIRGMPGW